MTFRVFELKALAQKQFHSSVVTLRLQPSRIVSKQPNFRQDSVLAIVMKPDSLKIVLTEPTYG